MRIGLISHSDCALHEMGQFHPEHPARLEAIQKALHNSGLQQSLHCYDAIKASREQLYLAHDASYVDEVFAKAPTQGHVSLDPDTSMNPHSLSAACFAAGALIQGVDLVMSGKEKVVFCSVRPPGHHAEKDRAMGFCLFNNLAVGVLHARYKYELQKIAIVDFDVHHGNGTEDIIKNKSGILFCSSFQHPFYPFSGTERHPEHIVNTPLPAGTNSAQFREAITSQWIPRLETFQPEIIFISAGFDAHIEDDMAGLCLVDEDYAWVTQVIKKIADQYSQGRIISTLEGGYALPALGRSVVQHLRALAG